MHDLALVKLREMKSRLSGDALKEMLELEAMCKNSSERTDDKVDRIRKELADEERAHRDTRIAKDAIIEYLGKQLDDRRRE
jgi:hypothetical protein